VSVLIWLLKHYLSGRRRFFDLTAWLSVIGMALAVACLVVTMAVVSGYISTLEHSVQDAFGHLIVMKRGTGNAEQITRDVKAAVTDLVATTPFLMVEAIVAREGKLNGVIIEGMDPETLGKVLNLQERLKSGKFDLGNGNEEIAPALIGKGVAERFNLKIGDELKAVIPLSAEFDKSAFRPKLGKFKVAGVLDFGRYDFDSRYVVVNIAAAQRFAELKDKVTGLRLRLKDPMKAMAVSKELSQRYGYKYWTRDWVEVNKNLFEAAKLEKIVIFFVLLILIVAASFNVTSTMFVSVMRRYPDISILRTLGARSWTIRGLFIGQGLVVAWFGTGLGFLLGVLLCFGFEWLEKMFGLIPSQVYKLDTIHVDIRFLDLWWIFLATTLICMLATLIPASLGSRVQPVEGLRYE
jgi:lipoprotein-releasing system permease protein